ncbi:MAG: 3-oxoacyl-ACP reductase [Abditibacteriaceae bacterium]
MKNALISGGAGGLGKAIALELLQSGHRVFAADLSNAETNFESWKSTFDSEYLHFVVLDVTDYENCLAAVEQIESHGGVDVLVNAAGVTQDISLRKMEPAQWRKVLSVNLDGTFHLCRACINGMIENGFGRVINISSVNGLQGQFGQTNYAASKAGLHGLTMSLARETAAKGITVNSISPGYCDTEMVAAIPPEQLQKITAQIPVGRLAQPQEIARVVSFLAADDSAYITGANIPVTGGYWMGF